MSEHMICGERFASGRIHYFYGQAEMKPLIDPKTGLPVYKRAFLVYKIPLFEFTNEQTSPLTFVAPDGLHYRPYHHFVTDGGSIPRFLWAVPFVRLGPWDFPRAYPFHDSGFTYGGLYRLEDGVFVFRLMSRTRLNEALGDMIRADGGSVVDEGTVELGLKLGSSFCWDEKAQAANRKRDNVVEGKPDDSI